MFGRFLKVAIAMSKFMNKVYNGGFSPEFTVSMLKDPKDPKPRRPRTF